ncbi:unnamed protein product [Diatraea saccharalis]|uniref:C3H1-type domain-containing protein n=1 Tax=Diatraea saccharalis TaxID=40085 RepID=A0A9N9RC81_9NEOP|nr:unnamed protein product [Diatraea saccharalis]
MLPSTGYFKGINCPFYDNGLCERPYCHFRHVKKELQSTSNDTIESGAILQKLVSAAVQKVLQQTDSVGSTTETGVTTSDKNNSQPSAKVTYNPTPISELKKINLDSENKDDDNDKKRRHIPVPYTPRKPASLPIKRSIDTNGSSKPFIYIPPSVKYTPGLTDSVQQDQYTPKGGTELENKYLPGSETEIPEYKPNETQNATSKHNYVPSDKNVSKKKILEYKPAKVSSKNESSTVTYQPTPRSLVPCFSSDEDEPNGKKRKLSGDLNGFDDLGPEFDILDQILDEEQAVQDNELKSKEVQNNDNSNENKLKKESIKSNKDKDIKEKSYKSSKNEKHEKSKKEESSIHDKHKNKSKEQDKKSSSKKSSKDSKGEQKSKRDRKEIYDSEKKRHSSSRSSQESSKKSKHHSKHSEKASKHSDKSKNDSKSKKKYDHHRNHKSSRESKDQTKHRKSKEKHSNDKSNSDNIITDVFDSNCEDLYELSESDEESRAMECKRIFEEYVPTEKKCLDEVVDKIENTIEDEYVPTKKRISRTVDKNIKVIPKVPVKPDFKVNAAQAMSERLAKVKEYHASKKLDTIEPSSNKVESLKNVIGTSTVSSSKIRIAHVPYASTLMNAKKTISPSVSISKIEPSTSITITQTVKKGTQRVAHMPNEKFIDRPGVLEPLGSKIAANIRSTYLNMMIDECLKIYVSAVDAYARAQHEELTTSKKCSTIQIYKNSAVLTVNRLRKEFQECNGVKKSGSECLTLQKIPVAPIGNSNTAGTWSIENKNRRIVDSSKEFTGAKLYNNIRKWLLTEEQLQENGFPRPHPSGDKGRAIIFGQKKQNPPKGYIRTCCRCKKDYTVDKKGFAAVKQECIYHPNNKYRVRGEVRYQCCSQDGFSDGCCVAPSHVYEYVDYENLKGYVKTLPPETEKDDYGVYSLDCEMCYTTHGLDLTRVTVINSDCKVIYETLIKPLHPIVDFNTRYSGITEEQMAGVKTTLLEVQATLLAMFNNKTILIGHSLESDFKALKLIHDTVIDTSVLFPHKMGPPYKRALRNLSSEYLKKIIQNSVDGHDSAEDATVCMELIIFKLKEDLKTR